MSDTIYLSDLTRDDDLCASVLLQMALFHFLNFVVQSLSHVWLLATACQVSLSITNSRSLLKLMSIESVMPSNHLILCHSLLLLPSIFPSIRVFSNKLVLHIRWPKYWSFSFSISPSNKYSGLISFRINWFDLLVVQGTLKSLLQHHTFKGTVLQCSAFFIFHTYICIHIANSPPCTAETNTTL